MYCSDCGKLPVNVHLDTPQGTVHICSSCAKKRLGVSDIDQEPHHIELPFPGQFPGQIPGPMPGQFSGAIGGPMGNQVPQGIGPMPGIIAMIPIVPAQLIQREELPEIACEECGLTFREFLMNGRFACAGCYDAFAYEIRKQLVAVHGSCRYAGKFPARQFKHKKILKVIDRLRSRLDMEVQKENYETAAQLRDTIKNLELEVEKFI